MKAGKIYVQKTNLAMNQIIFHLSLSGCLLLGALLHSRLRFSVNLQLVLAGSPERRQAGIHFVRMRAEVQQLRRGLRTARHRKEVRAGNQAGHVLRQVKNVVYSSS